MNMNHIELKAYKVGARARLAGQSKTSATSGIHPEDARAKCIRDGWDDMALNEYVDEQVFLCAICGWWCGVDEIGDSDGDLMCRDCVEEEG